MGPREAADRIDELDVSLFDHIHSQTSEADRRALLALQSAIRQRQGAYTYLEIGSHMGGTLQPYVVDPLCERIISIDPRPIDVPDDRSEAGVTYEDNSTGRMLTLLGGVQGADVSKIETIEASTENIPAERVTSQPALCFVDAEHTNEAGLRDAVFCLSVCAPNAVIAFHDRSTVHRALAAVLSVHGGVGYRTGSSIFVIETGSSDLYTREPVAGVVDNPSLWGAANRAGAAGWLTLATPVLGRAKRLGRRAERSIVD